MLKRIKKRVTGLLSSLRWIPLSPRPENGVEERQEDEPSEESQLFYCPECDSVYIATDKHTCSSCDCPVESVPPALRDRKRK